MQDINSHAPAFTRIERVAPGERSARIGGATITSSPRAASRLADLACDMGFGATLMGSAAGRATKVEQEPRFLCGTVELADGTRIGFADANGLLA